MFTHFFGLRGSGMSFNISGFFIIAQILTFGDLWSSVLYSLLTIIYIYIYIYILKQKK